MMQHVEKTVAHAEHLSYKYNHILRTQVSGIYSATVCICGINLHILFILVILHSLVQRAPAGLKQKCHIQSFYRQ